MHSPQQQQPPQWQQPYQQAPIPPRRRMSPLKWSLIAAGVVVLLVVGLVLVSTVVAKVAGSLPSASATPNRTAEPAIAPKVPKPNADQAEALLIGLRGIDKELGRARSIDRARNSCSDLLAGEKRSTVVERTRQRFDGVADIDTADARAIVKLIEDGGWCRKG